MKQYAKAILGAVVAFLGAVLAILGNNNGHITLTGWLSSALVGFAALNSVWAIPNTPPPVVPAPPA